MYRLLLRLGSLVLVAVWGGVAPVHAVPPDVVNITVEGVIISQEDTIQKVTLIVTNNTDDFYVKGFAVTAVTATRADTDRDEWDAEATNENPIPELEGSGGAITHFEYVFYYSDPDNAVDGNYLGPHSSDNSFTFELDVPPDTTPPLGPLPVGILVVDQDGVEFACLSTIGSDGCRPTIRGTPPDCTAAVASVSALWPPNHTLVPINIAGVPTSYESPVSITVDSISQDEPVQEAGAGSGNTCPDGRGVGTDTAQVRAERAGKGNGRVYHVAFTADNGQGTCTEVVRVCVPHDQGRGKTCINDGPLYDSTVCPSRRQ